MEVRPDFAERVAALSSSTPREAIANLLSALMPRVAAKTRRPEPPYAPIPPSPKPKWQGYDVGREPVGQYDPMTKLTKGRSPKVRKPLPAGKLTWVRGTNPKKGKSAARFNQYYGMNGMTAASIVRLTDITASDIQWDVEHNFVRFE